MVLVGRNHKIECIEQVRVSHLGLFCLLIGSGLIERALERQYGQDYLSCLEKVPVLIPWKGRVLL